MAFEYGFFWDSNNGDRKYNAECFEHWLKKFFRTGVFNGDLKVLADSSMSITVSPGYCNVDGKIRFFQEETVLAIETAGATQDRIDSVVIERNDIEREITLKIVKGDYAEKPVAKELVRSGGIYQLAIAQIRVEAGAVKITQVNIKDTRTSLELCGLVAGTVSEMDFSQLQAQFEAFYSECEETFEEWLNDKKGQLGEEIEGDLQEQINAERGRVDLLKNETEKLEHTIAVNAAISETDFDIADICLQDTKVDVFKSTSAVAVGDYIGGYEFLYPEAYGGGEAAGKYVFIQAVKKNSCIVLSADYTFETSSENQNLLITDSTYNVTKLVPFSELNEAGYCKIQEDGYIYVACEYGAAVSDTKLFTIKSPNDCKDLQINITYDSTGKKLKSNKTYAEVLTACLNGRSVYAVYGANIYMLQNVSAQSLIFENVMLAAESIKITTLVFYADETVGMSAKYVPHTVDTELSTESVNPVQNKVVSAELGSLSKGKASSIIETASGTPVIITDSAEAEPVSLEVYGKSEQTQLSGKNLFPYGDLSSTGTGNVLALQPLELPVGQYAFSMFPNVSDDVITTVGFFDAEKNQIYSIGQKNSYWITGKSITFELTTECKYITVYVREAIKLTKIQIESGSAVTDYEAYCGGTPSPNPDYPQEIVNAGSYYDSVDKYVVTVKSTGKNVLKNNAKTQTVNGVTFTVNDDGTVNVNGTATAKIEFHINQEILLSAGNYILNGCPTGGTTSSYRLASFLKDGSKIYYVVTGEDKQFTLNVETLIDTYIVINAGVAISNLVFKPMIRHAEITDSTFEPYKETSKSIYLDEPLREGDVICQKDGVWGVERHRQSYVTTGAEALSTASNNRYMINLNGLKLPYAVNAYSGVNGLASHLNAVSQSSLGADDIEGFAVNAVNAYIRLSADSTEDDIRALLAKGLAFEYTLEAPTFTPFEDQTVFEGLSMFYPNTVMSNDFNTEMSVEYIADTKAYVDKLKAIHEADIQVLKTAIIALGGTI